MKNSKFRIKKLMPLVASITVLSGPIIFVSACASEDITRYPAALPNDMNNRILFSFAGVNYYVTAKDQFSNDYSANINFVKQKVEYIMGQQKMFEFFHDKLKYDKKTSLATVKSIVDQLGLNALVSAYGDTLNTGNLFDSTSIANNNIIMQTSSWNTNGSLKFDYTKYDGYNPSKNGLDPNETFTNNNLIADLGDKPDDIDAIANKMQTIIDTTDNNFTDIAKTLIPHASTWTGTDSNVPTYPTWSQANPGDQSKVSIDVQQMRYERAINRFKLWLRFRYQQYYATKILPDLGVTVFTMANILDSIFKVDSDSATPKITLTNTKYAQQLQSWSSNEKWNSNYRLAFDYTTDVDSAINIDKNWSTKTLPDLISTDSSGKPTGLNSYFINNARNSNDNTVSHAIDPALGISSFTKGDGRPYAAVKTFTDAKTTPGWITTSDATQSHYWVNNQKASFAYVAPIFFIDVVNNLNFNQYNPSTKATITADTSEKMQTWLSGPNTVISNTSLSQYLRGDAQTATNKNLQATKWSLFWQMLYYLSDQTQKNGSKDASDNFTAAANILFPEYIKKEQIYDKAFWGAVSSYYTS